MKKLLVTSALPYANGQLHLGHMLEFIQTDIWVRFNKLIGNDCLYVGADDAHGTAIMLKAEQQGITPKALIEQVNQDHQRDLNGFHINFDHYHSTHSSENKELSYQIYNRLVDNNYIARRTITQLFDEHKQLFLADRFVKGACPKCNASDQYGDNCEVCGATYDAMDLIDPRSTLSDSILVQKESEHYFFQLEKFDGLLQEWLGSGSLQTEVANKLQEWLETGLKSWDISRDAPYFGFTIPGNDQKYFYVWLDAPIGYMSSLAHLAKSRPEINFAEYWGKDAQSELVHFIGKDIISFHGLFWPAMLQGAGFRLPTAIYAHGFVTVNGTKMSKSRGIFITAQSYLDHLNPEYLRYYFASKLTSGVEDIDINFDNFVAKINSDLVGKIVNIASRCSKFIEKDFDGYLGDTLNDELIDRFMGAGDEIAELYQQREYSKATRLIIGLADKANQYIDQEKPWVLAKNNDNLLQVQAICSTGINCFKILAVYLQPILPVTIASVSRFLSTPLDTWQDSQQVLKKHQLAPFKPLMTRVTKDQIAAMLDL